MTQVGVLLRQLQQGLGALAKAPRIRGLGVWGIQGLLGSRVLRVWVV